MAYPSAGQERQKLPAFAKPSAEHTHGELLRARLWSELAPRTQYEEMLASNIVDLELAHLSSRRRVDGILRVAKRDIVFRTLVGLLRDVRLDIAERQARDAAIAFTNGDASATDALLHFGILGEDIEAQAYSETWQLIREIDQVQAGFERRRVDLMQNYRSVQAETRQVEVHDVDDAEVA